MIAREVDPDHGHAAGASVRVRPLADSDRAVAQRLFEAEIERGNPYAPRAHELLDAVGTAGGYHAHVAECGGAVVGVGIFGLVAGASGAGALHAIVVEPSWRRSGAGRALVGAAEATLREMGARFAMLELPDDPGELGGVAELLAAAGFRENARVPDLYRDGVALTFQLRRLD
jgi:ribosomal protein S18 acetylase RimI-like enzyme